MVDFEKRIKALRSEVEALKTASRSTPDGLRTITKTINISAELTVYSTYIDAYYFIKLFPVSSDSMVFSVSQKPVVVSDDVIISSAVPRLKNGQNGTRLNVAINYQRQQYYLEHYSQGDTITKDVSIKITASDDFEYEIEKDS